MATEDTIARMTRMEGDVNNLKSDVAVLRAESSWMKTSLEIMTRLPSSVAEMSIKHDRLEAELRDDVKGCKDDTKYLRDRLDEREKERKLEIANRRKERKSDMKYLITTIIATGGLVAAAVALFH